MKSLNVIYIAGSGRSGTTLVDRILGSHPGVASFNELYKLFEHGYGRQWPCSCGASIGQCPFWNRVLPTVVRSDAEARRLIELSDRLDRSWLFFFVRSGWLSRRLRQDLDEYREALRRLLFAISEVSGCTTMVDSSKVPTRALIMAGVPGVAVHVLHVTRNPLAVVTAWQRRKFDPGRGGDMKRHTAARTLAYWVSRQLLSLQLGKKLPYELLRYEDLVAAPQAEVRRLASRLPLGAGGTSPFTAERVVNLQPVHSLSGNPDRFMSGPTPIRNDAEVSEEVARRPAVRLALALIGPLRRRFGY